MEVTPLDWQEDAKCRDIPPGVFFHDEEISDEDVMAGHYQKKWQKICNSCPVKGICLQTAVVYNFDGIWGGMTQRQRSRIFGADYRQEIIQELKDTGQYFPLDYVM